MSTLMLPSTAPGFDDPLGMLHACHQKIDRQLDTLDRLRRHVALQHADEQARNAATKIIRYFTTAAPNHHADEELSLFPRLLSAAPELSSTIASLERDHADIDARWRRLNPCLASIVAASGAYLSPWDVNQFCELNRMHIAREEREILDVAAELLGAEALTAIGREMARRRERLGS